MELDLKEMTGHYTIAKLAQSAPMPDWLPQTGVVTVTRAEEELSIVCLKSHVPEGVETGGDWRMFQVTPTFDFDAPGVVLAATRPISEAGLGVFVTSTFLRDYVLVKADKFETAKSLLVSAGHRFI